MNSPRPQSTLNRLRGRAFHLWFRLARPMTMGAQAIVLDERNQVFLVRHSYVPGWHFPGGGVEPGETVLQALERELREEGNIVLTGRPRLHGIFFNTLYSQRDHVVVYIVRNFRQTGPRLADSEIVETGFFAADSLPPGIAGGTLARLKELLEGIPVSDVWGP